MYVYTLSNRVIIKTPETIYDARQPTVHMVRKKRKEKMTNITSYPSIHPRQKIQLGYYFNTKPPGC